MFTINALTFGALKNNIITVFGGKQIRPNLTMYDMISAYIFALKENINVIEKPMIQYLT